MTRLGKVSLGLVIVTQLVVAYTLIMQASEISSIERRLRLERDG